MNPNGVATDWLGFDKGLRSLDGGINRQMVKYPGTNTISLTDNGLNNDWSLKERRPVADVSFNVALNRKWADQHDRQYGFIATLNYSNAYKTFLNMENSLFGTYDETQDHSVYLQ